MAKKRSRSKKELTADDCLVGTLHDRLDGDPLLDEWLSAQGSGFLERFFREEPDADSYFSLLAEAQNSDDWDELDDFGQSSYERSVGPAVDRLEDAFLAWVEERRLTQPLNPGRRSRESALATPQP